MAEPARNLYDDDENEGIPQGAKDIRPSFGIVDGDGEGDGKPAGNLRSVDDSSLYNPSQENEADSLDGQDKRLKDLSQDEASDLGFNYRSDKEKVSGFKDRFKGQRKNWKKYAAATTVGGSIIGLVVSAFFALLPLKFEFIVNFISDQVSTVPQYAVEKRVDYLLSRYVSRSILGAGTSTDAYIGNSLGDTLFNSWRGANFEADLRDNFGLEFSSENRNISGQATEWNVKSDGRIIGGGLGDFNLDAGDNIVGRTEMRQIIRAATRDSTQWHQFMKRRTQRRILQNKFNVPVWFVDVFGSRASEGADDIRSSYVTKKRDFQKWTVNQTIGRVSVRYATYFGCLVDGGDDCKTLRDDRGTIDTPNAEPAIDETFDELADVNGEVPDVGDRNVVRSIMDKIRKFGLRKVMGTAIAGLGVADFISDVVTAIDDGRLTEMSYRLNVDASVGFAAAVNTGISQLNDGTNILSEDSQILFERFQGFESSPVYAAALGQISGFGFNPLGQISGTESISRECYNDGEFETVALAPGEVACPSSLFYNPRFEDTIKALPGWDALVSIDSVYDGTVGFVFGALVDLVGNLDFVSGLMERAIASAGFDDDIAAGVDLVTEQIFNPACVGAEVGEAAFDCFYAGEEAINNEVAVSGGEYGIGGRALTDIEVVAIYEEVEADRKNEFQQKSFFARLFDTNDYNSLVGHIAMATPSTTEGVAESLTTAFLSPTNTISSLISQPVVAQSQPANFNPFGIIRYGYPTDSPAFTAEFDSAALAECGTDLTDKRAEPELVDGIVFPIHTTTDPCALERVTTNVLGCLFSTDDNCGVDAVNSFQVDSTISATGEYLQVVCNQPAVAVTPASNLSSLVASNPEGTCFELSAGTYQVNNIQPKEGMTFVGAGPEITILDGRGHDVAFHGASNGVTISNMTLRNYDDLGPGGSFPQPQAPIRPNIGLWEDPLAEGWLVDSVHSYGNISSGVQLGSYWTVQNSKFFDNGVTGVSGSTIVGGSVLGNEVYGNGFNGATGPGVNAAGMKFGISGTREEPVIVQDNEVYSNIGGIGIWCDIACQGFHVINNVVRDEEKRGIYYEISSGAVIRGNQLDNIGSFNPDFTRDWEPGAIGLGESADTIIEDNIITNSRAGVVITQTKRPAPDEIWLQENINTWGDNLNLVIGNVQVIGNTINNTNGMGVAVGGSAGGIDIDHNSIVFRDNTYSNPESMRFGVAGRNSSYAEWQANGWQ